LSISVFSHAHYIVVLVLANISYLWLCTADLG